MDIELSIVSRVNVDYEALTRLVAARVEMIWGDSSFYFAEIYSDDIWPFFSDTVSCYLGGIA
jgi:hypothetical protein